MLARRFLWVIAGLTILFMAGLLAYRLFEAQLMKLVLVPDVEFETAPPIDAPAYRKAGMWIARPDIADNVAAWMPKGATAGPSGGAEGNAAGTNDPLPASPPAKAGAAKKALLFFIHPTSYLEKSHWNAPLDDQESQWRARLFVQSQASAFNAVAEVWAPKYRQATFGAFLPTKADAGRALDFAYRDILAAWRTFLAMAPKDRPILLAAHSQGSLHLVRLLAEEIGGKAEANRIVAAYVVGWPISTSADLPKLGLPACETVGQARCILSWQSFAEPADPKMVTDVYDASRGLTGAPRTGTPMLCVNPLTGARSSKAAPATANLGTIVPNKELTDGELRLPGVPARCDVRGFLLIGPGPDLGPYTLPGNNYHVYDYALFWPNIRADAAARLSTYLGEKASSHPGASRDLVTRGRSRLPEAPASAGVTR